MGHHPILRFVTPMALALSMTAGLAAGAAAQANGKVDIVADANAAAEAERFQLTLPETLMTTGATFAAQGEALQAAKSELDDCLSMAASAAAAGMAQASVEAAPAVSGKAGELMNAGACQLPYFDARIGIAVAVAEKGLDAEARLLAQSREVMAAKVEAEKVAVLASAEGERALADQQTLLSGFAERALELRKIAGSRTLTREEQLQIGGFRRMIKDTAIDVAAAKRNQQVASNRAAIFESLGVRLEQTSTNLGELARDQQTVIKGARDSIQAIEQGAALLALKDTTAQSLGVILSSLNDLGLDDASGPQVADALAMGGDDLPSFEIDAPVSVDVLTDIYRAYGMDLDKVVPVAADGEVQQ